MKNLKANRTNSKIVKNLVKQYILETVYDDNENMFLSFKDAANHLNNEFKRVANHPYNLQRYPNDVNRFLDYLQGLPFYFLQYDDDVKEFLNSLGINPGGKIYESSTVWNLYAILIYREIVKF